MRFLNASSLYALLRSGVRFSIKLAPALFLFASLTHAQAAPPLPPTLPPQGEYTITDLGVLTTRNDTDSSAVSINNNGTVVGVSGIYFEASEDEGEVGYFNTDAFVWTPDAPNGTTGNMIYAALPGDTCMLPDHTVGGLTTPAHMTTYNTALNDINSTGQAVGLSWTSSSGNCDVGQQDGMLVLNGAAQDLHAPPQIMPSPPLYGLGVGIYSEADAINDAGLVAGFANGNGSPEGSVWLYDGSYHLLGPPPLATIVVPTKINSTGTMVGYSDVGAFVHTGFGQLQLSDLIPDFTGNQGTAAFGINNAGMVVGEATALTSGDFAYHAFFIDQNGLMHDLGTISPDPLANSVAYSINNSAHDVVGTSDIDLAPDNAFAQLQHAVLWPSGGRPADLNLLLDPRVVVSNTCPNCWELISANAINDMGQIVGEGMINGFRHAFLLTPKCMNDGGDTDGDGLCDNWEKYGYTDPKTGMKVDLPKMGAHWDHKDIFVQADYMVDSTPAICAPPYTVVQCGYSHTHKPNPDAMAMVIQAFANAPVENPDGLTGINIHIDCGPDCVMDPETGATWDNLSMANAIDPEVTPLGTGSCMPEVGTCSWDTTYFSALLDSFTATGRAASFHYMVFAHAIGIPATGLSLNSPDSSFMVGLGVLFVQNPQQTFNQVGTKTQQATVFMHELGHNLGLYHGGMDTTNHKPNYLSIMNYWFSLNGLMVNGTAGYLDYSKFSAIPALDEFALSEPIGLNGGPAIANYGTRYTCFPGILVGGVLTMDEQDRYVLNANGPIDWNCNSTIDPNTLTDGLDIDQDLDPAGDEVVVSAPLVSSDDWGHLIFAGGAIGALNALPPALPSVVTTTEPAFQNYQLPYQLQVVSPGLGRVLPGETLNLTFTIYNTGLQADTYNLTPVSQFNWWDTSGVPASVSIAAGASQSITIPVTVPASFGCSNVGSLQATFLLRAVSQTYPALSESGSAELDLFIQPGMTILPSAVGLTQSAAQAAITSAGFAVGAVTTQSSTSVPAGTVISQNPAGCGFATAATAISIVVSSGPPLTTVPNVVGQTQVAAFAALNAAGLFFSGSETMVSSSSIPAGDVVSQSPPAGTQVTPGTFYSLTIASATPVAGLTPSFVGDSISAAMSAIAAAGFNLGLITQAVSLTAPEGTVLSQVPAVGAPISPGAYINVTVSYNFEIQNIPNIVGSTQASAISTILLAGFSVGSIGETASNTAPAGTVVFQSPLPGGTPSPTTPVSFSISTGPVGPQSFVVPNVTGLTQSQASSAITTAGLTPAITPAQALSVPVGDVISQTPQPGAYAAGGSTVTLQVSAAAPQYTVPNLVTTPGTYYTTAYTDIIAAGLTPGTFTAEISSTVGSEFVISQSPAAGTVVPGGSVVNVTYSIGIPTPVNVVPNVVGDDQVFAQGILLNSGEVFFISSVTRESSTTVPDGFVISQNPAAGTQVPVGSSISLVVSSGGPVTAAIPNVVGTSLSQFNRTGAFPAGSTEPTLNAAGFSVGSVTYQPSNSVPIGQVISQTPPAGTVAAWDTPVSLVYSSGPPVSITMPNIVGETQGLALATLSVESLISTLTTQSSQAVPAGVVISQNPPAGTVLQGMIPPGVFNVPVTFVVSAGPKTVPTYSLLTQFGDYGSAYAGDGQFDIPEGLTVDPSTGNILAGDITGRIQVFDSHGNFLRYFSGTGVQAITTTVPGTTQQSTLYPTGTGGGLFADGTIAEGYPVALAVDPVNGNVIALDAAERVLIFNSAGVFLSTFGSPGTGPGQFSYYRGSSVATGGVAIDPVTENILVTDWGNNRVQIFSSTGVYLSQFGTQGSGNGQFGYGPIGIAIDPETRNIAVMDSAELSGTARVEIFNSSGAYLSQFGPPVQAAGACWAGAPCFAADLAIDPTSHNIIVQGGIGDGSSAYPAIQIFDSKGNFLSQFGGFGISVPGGMALDPVSHHILTFGLSSDFGGNVQIFGEPLPLTPTSTALTSSLNPANSGQSVTFTANVTGGTGITGTVQFFYGGASLGAPIPLASGSASLTTSTLPIGTDSISAIYSGDGNYATSSGLLNETVAGSGTTTVLAASPNPAVAGQAVTLTATVTGTNPTGTIVFLNGSGSLGTAVPLSSGVATFTTSSLPVGTDSLTAVYSGDANNATSTSAVLSEVVALAPSNTVLGSSANLVPFGQPVTFIATVTGDSPTGTVQFLDSGTSLGSSVALIGNVASLTLSTLSAGTHPITAVYSGDKFNATSISAVVNELVSLNGVTSTALLSSVDPVTIGQPVTFTATVKGTSGLTGTVQFMDGPVNLGNPVVLAAGVANFTTSSLTAGTHSVVAVYSGDASNAPSTSPTLSEVVSLNTTSTTVASSTNPAIFGQPVTFTASVGGNNPSGPITFLDGTTPLLTLTPASNATGKLKLTGQPFGSQSLSLVNGQASVTISSLSVGKHSITAVYSGDAMNTASTSAILSQVVQSSAPPPVVTPPAPISIPATQATGATSAAWPALAAFLSAATATSTLPTAPVQLAPEVGGLAVTSSTVFPIGTTAVTFSFQDANGNTGTATSTVTVAVGQPRITGSVASVGRDPSGAIYFNIVLTNTGTGNARNLVINTLQFRAVGGTGTVVYNSALSPVLPLAIGNLNVGASVTTKFYLNVPSTVTRVALAESGPVQDVLGTNYTYSTAQVTAP